MQRPCDGPVSLTHSGWNLTAVTISFTSIQVWAALHPCRGLLTKPPASSLGPLQSIQHTAARESIWNYKSVYSTLLHKRLHQFPIILRINSEGFTTTYEDLYDLIPSLPPPALPSSPPLHHYDHQLHHHSTISSTTTPPSSPHHYHQYHHHYHFMHNQKKKASVIIILVNIYTVSVQFSGSVVSNFVNIYTLVYI